VFLDERGQRIPGNWPDSPRPNAHDIRGCRPAGSGGSLRWPGAITHKKRIGGTFVALARAYLAEVILIEVKFFRRVLNRRGSAPLT
jgi:hypothetical protein